MEPRDAATVMLVRDAPGLEVFMLRRNLRSVFVAGAYVFPGGAVDAEDHAEPLRAAIAGIDERVAGERLGRADALGFWVATIRETFEEAGVLLARDPATGTPVDVPGDDPSLDADRRSLLAGERSFTDIVRERGVVLDGGALAPVARWITPRGAPRRYDTWFFVAAAPAGAYVHDDDETVASVWISPTDALERARRQELELIYPTFRSLQALARFDTAAALLATVEDAWRADESPFRVENPDQGWMLRVLGEEQDALDAAEHSVRTGRRARSG